MEEDEFIQKEGDRAPSHEGEIHAGPITAWAYVKAESGLFWCGSSLGSPGAETGTLAIAV